MGPSRSRLALALAAVIPRSRWVWYLLHKIVYVHQKCKIIFVYYKIIFFSILRKDHWTIYFCFFFFKTDLMIIYPSCLSRSSRLILWSSIYLSCLSRSSRLILWSSIYLSYLSRSSRGILWSSISISFFSPSIFLFLSITIDTELVR